MACCRGLRTYRKYVKQAPRLSSYLENAYHTNKTSLRYRLETLIGTAIGLQIGSLTELMQRGTSTESK
jgi:hypothetical protein